MTNQEQIERQKIVQEALTWLGTKYHACARVKGVGVDCGLFIAEVFERCGIVPHIDPGHYVAEYALHQSEEIYASWVQKYAVKITDRPPLPGDILLYKFGQCRSHGAIVVDYPQIIHAYIRLGVIIDTAEASYLAGRECDIYSVWGNKSGNVAAGETINNKAASGKEQDRQHKAKKERKNGRNN